MIKARFMSEQQPVRIIRDENKAYVFLYLNGKHGVFEDKYNKNGNSISEEFIEYDYNEFVVNANEIDLKDVKKNPEKYLNYPLPQVTELEQLRADVDYLLMLEG